MLMRYVSILFSYFHNLIYIISLVELFNSKFYSSKKKKKLIFHCAIIIYMHNFGKPGKEDQLLGISSCFKAIYF